MKTLMVILLALSVFGCHDDDRVTLPPGVPADSIACYPWNRDGPVLDVDLPVSHSDRSRYKLCLRGEFCKDRAHRRSCYYDCPTWNEPPCDKDLK